jgi:ADP-heptose:LPS heptosyltransferase
MNVLVLNLTRLGDLLQSQPVIAGLKAGGCRVGLLCLDNFAGAAALMAGVDELFQLPGGRLLARLADGDGGWKRALAEQRALLVDIRARFAPDVVVNLTPSEPARLLAMQCGAAEVRGFALDREGFNADSGLWAAFLQLAAQARGASPFNVVDIFRRIAGLTGAPDLDGNFGLRRPDEAVLADMRARILARFPAPPPNGLVALQLGASEDRRRWPVAHFAHLARLLWAAGYGPVLVGTDAERPLGARFCELSGVPAADFMGETSLPELAAALANCRLLATNDTGTMHLAAGLGVPCLAFFMATAQPWDTGPYLPGCLCLESDLLCHPCAFGADCPRNLECRSHVKAEDAAELALAVLNGRDPADVPTGGARVWRTRIGDGGLMDLESLSGHEAEDRTRLVRLQRALYRRYLDGDGLDPDAMAGALPEARLGREAAEGLHARMDEALALLTLLSSQGALLMRNPLPQAKAKFLGTWQRVQGALAQDARLSVLALLWRFEAERPGLDLDGILALAGRYAGLLEAMRGKIICGTDSA